MTPDISFLVFAQEHQKYAKVLAHVRHHAPQFYGNCRTTLINRLRD